MTESTNEHSRPTKAGPEEAVEFLGGQPNEVAMFALAHTPILYRPLTDTEVSNLRAAVQGALPPELSGSIRELLKNNAAATELVMAEQLLTAAARGGEIPWRLSRTILGPQKLAPNTAPKRTWSVQSWLYAGMGAAAAAAVAIAVSFYGFNHPGGTAGSTVAVLDNPSFTVAVLDNREILSVPTDGGGGSQQPTAPKPLDVRSTVPVAESSISGNLTPTNEQRSPLAATAGTAGERAAPALPTPPEAPPELRAAEEPAPTPPPRPEPPPTKQSPSKPGLKYVEIDVSKGQLAPFFADDQSGKGADERAVIARLSAVFNETEKVDLIFDAAIKPLLRGDMKETLNLRVYDLSDPVNLRLALALYLASALHRSSAARTGPDAVTAQTAAPVEDNDAGSVVRKASKSYFISLYAAADCEARLELEQQADVQKKCLPHFVDVPPP